MPLPLLRMLLIGLISLGANMVYGEDFPNKPIRIVTSNPGGGSDFVARVIAQGLTSNLGKQVIVENRGGAGGIIAALTVAKGLPDGYTLLLYASNLWLLPYLQDNVPYDPVRDFLPITLADSSPNLLVVHPSVPVNSVKELIALAKAKPGALNYAQGALGSPPHLSAELFKAMAGVDIVRIAYKSSGPAIFDLIGGRVQLMFSVPGAATPHVKSGKLKALAVTSAQPSDLFPGMPTVAASGVPGYVTESNHGLFAPAKTPVTLINRLNQEIVRVLKQPDVKEKFLNIGVEPVGGSPKEYAAYIKSDMAKMGKVIKDAGIRAD
ncbi:MAG: tripartite tricarboxylate transporter substrate binding protein [Betaproteobacteria bacterium]|nr:tripartite tricarboxylate transporter substrate binding protein [Betaproteobacteria bacterium]